MHLNLPTREPPPGDRHQRRLQPADVEPVLERQPHVARAVQVVRDVRAVHEAVVFGESRRGRVVGFERLEDRPRRVDPRLHREVNALQRRHVHETGGVPQQHDAVAGAPLGERVESSFRDRLRAPLDHLPALEDVAKQRMQLHALEQDVDVERRVPVIEPDDQSQRDQIRLERIHEAAAERIAGERPAEGVDDAIEGTLRLPDLFHAEGEDLRVGGRHAVPLAPGLRQQRARPLGERHDLRGEIVGRLVRVARRAVAVQARRGGAHAGDAPALREQMRRRESREHVDAQRLGPGAEPAHDLADRRDEVAAVVHRGRRRQPQRASPGEQVHGFFADGVAERQLGIGDVGEQLAKRPGIDDRAGERVFAQRFGFLQDTDVELRALALREVGQLDGARQPRGPRADDEDVQLHAVARAGGLLGQDQPIEGQRWLVARRDELLRAPCSLSHAAS